MTEKEREETVAGIEDDLKKLEQSATTDLEGSPIREKRQPDIGDFDDEIGDDI